RLAQDFIGEAEEKEGISRDLKDYYLEQIWLRLKNVSSFWCFPPYPWKNRFLTGVLIFMACGSLWAFFPSQFPLGPGVLFPFGSAELSRFVGILPGDGFVDWGGTAEVRVCLLSPSLTKPVLFVKTGDDWLPLSPQKEFESVQF